MGGDTRKDRIEPTEVLDVGDFDQMSSIAVRWGLPLCGLGGCTRAAGHDEAAVGHPGTQHVVTGPRYIVLEVWW